MPRPDRHRRPTCRFGLPQRVRDLLVRYLERFLVLFSFGSFRLAVEDFEAILVQL